MSVGVEEKEENELEDAALMAKHVGAKHHCVIADSDSFLDTLDHMVYHHDSPFTDTSAYPTFCAARLARDCTDIILTGDGPDQIMGGSGHYVFAVRNKLFGDRSKALRLLWGLGAKGASLFAANPVPSFISRLERKFHRDSLPPVHAAYDLRSYFPDIVKQFICTDDLWAVHTRNSPYRHPDAWFEKGAWMTLIGIFLLTCSSISPMIS